MSTAPITEPTTLRWTRGEYYRLAEQGLFDDRIVELVEGEIIEMPPPGNAHCVSVECVADALRTAFGRACWVRVQMPINLGTHSEPIPDVAVVTGTPRDYSDHPTEALLIVEVSNTSLRFDRVEKASLYAKAGIAEYWIVNLVDRRLEVHRNPAPDEQAAFGFSYLDITPFGPDKTASAAAVEHVPIRVSDLLP